MFNLYLLRRYQKIEVAPADRTKSALTTSFGVVLIDNALMPFGLCFYARNILGIDQWA
jgi:hypothetical protein